MLFQKIRSADYSLDDYIWEHVSADAKDCVKKLLTVRLAEHRFLSNFFLVTFAFFGIISFLPDKHISVQVDTASRMTVSQALQHPWILVSPKLFQGSKSCSS